MINCIHMAERIPIQVVTAAEFAQPDDQCEADVSTELSFVRTPYPLSINQDIRQRVYLNLCSCQPQLRAQQLRSFQIFRIVNWFCFFYQALVV